MGKELGIRIIDVLIRDMVEKLQTQLCCMKYVCTNFWKYVFGKQVDNLRTNNSGTFIFIDESFKFIARLSCADPYSPAYVAKVRCYEAYVIGLIKGALFNLGFDHAP